MSILENVPSAQETTPYKSRTDLPLSKNKISPKGAQPISMKLIKGWGRPSICKRTSGYRRAPLARYESPLWILTGFACYSPFSHNSKRH